MFVEGKDLEIAKSVDAFFLAVQERWPEAWNAFGRGFVLNKTSGFRALMRLLRLVYLECSGANEVLQKAPALAILQRSQIQDDQFNTEVYKPGSSGEAQLFRNLRDSCGLEP